MRLTYYGHYCFLVETGEHRLLIDPFFEGNKLAPVSASNVKCGYILVTHGHDDHTGDVLPVAMANDALVIANFEIAEFFGAQGVRTHGMNPGGGFDFPFGRLKLTLAHHTSSLNAGIQPIYLGTPCGLLVTTKDRKTLYHAGDTALFLDMQLIGRAGIDVALLPIGDNFTMGIDDAVEALDLLHPKLAVPMHFNTFAEIRQDPFEFHKKAAARGHAVHVMAPGDTLAV